MDHMHSDIQTMNIFALHRRVHFGFNHIVRFLYLPRSKLLLLRLLLLVSVTVTRSALPDASPAKELPEECKQGSSLCTINHISTTHIIALYVPGWRVRPKVSAGK